MFLHNLHCGVMDFLIKVVAGGNIFVAVQISARQFYLVMIWGKL